MNNMRANVEKRKFRLEVKYLLKTITGLSVEYRKLCIIPRVSWRMLKIKIFLVPANGGIHLRVALG